MTETIVIRMLRDVRPAFPFMKPGYHLSAGEICDAASNPLGAISGMTKCGELLGVKPGEFEFVEAPQWVLDIWMPDATKQSAMKLKEVSE